MIPTARRTSDPSNAPSDGVVRPFHCITCSRSFTRADHLRRHARAHTREKPYTCPICGKGFSRVDLVKRHAAAHAANNDIGCRRRETIHQSRVVQACEACSQQHLRCEDEKPCKRCRRKNMPCHVLPAAVGNAIVAENSAIVDELPDLPDIDELHDTSSVAEDAGPSEQTRQTSSLHSIGVQSLYPELAMPSIVDTSPVFSGEDNFLAEYLHNVPPIEACVSGTATPRGIMDWNFDWDINLNDMDMGFLDQYNMQIPFNAETPSDHQRSQQDSTPEVSNEGLAVRHEAFKKSVWRFLPQSNRDFGAAEEPNLAYIDASVDNPPRRNRANLQPAVPSRLNRVGRDKLLALVLGTCQPTNISRVACSFPTTELLDGLLQYFFTSPIFRAKEIVHVPTFDASKIPPVLLANMVAAGAVATPDIALRKLGFALQEASRIEQAQIFEGDNTSIRDLQYHRNMILQLEIGMWSGISRKMEISESFLLPLVTMMRRGGRFRRSMYKDIGLSEHDEGAILEEKWKQWIRQESYLRLVYRVFEHDTQSSMALLKPPLISYSEMQLPLPHPDSLWSASSPLAWKTMYFSSTRSLSARPSPTDCFLDLDHLDHHKIAPSVYLHMVWGMIWEYRQLASLIGKSVVSQTGGLILTSWQQELSKHLENFRMHITTPLDVLLKEIKIQLELLHVHLNTSIDEIQIFAGIEGQEEARRVWPALQTWVDTPAARQALWHSGQVLHAIRSLPKGLLCNFNAIAAYHAGLVLWVYGLLKRPPANSSSRQSEESEVFLDGEENLDLRRFITLGRGVPALGVRPSQSHSGRISDVTSIMETLIEVLKDNHDSPNVPCPPLIDNLLQLLEGLKSAIRANSRSTSSH